MDGLEGSIGDLVIANRILAKEEVVDAYGHVSIRHPLKPDHYLLSRSLSPEFVTRSDIIEFKLDGTPVNDSRPGYLERFIHGAIYRARPDVMAVVHSHSSSVIPFGITRGKMRPVYHMASFLWSGVPVFDLAKVQPENDVLIRDARLGRELAKSIGPCACVLMRGHGMTVVGDSLPEVVFRSIYTQMNAKLQTLAGQLEGPIEFLSDIEGKLATATNHATLERPWELWKAKAMATLKG